MRLKDRNVGNSEFQMTLDYGAAYGWLVRFKITQSSSHVVDVW